jgi:uncharacterized protein (DUF1810 family)
MEYRFDLQRFVDAQAPVYDVVRAELKAGRKQTHWMWFVFPQMAGLGRSDMARRYAIADIEEARAYLAHPLLADHLDECCRLVAAFQDRTAAEIFGAPDDVKFHSSMTLFSAAAPEAGIFDVCLSQFFGGKPDQATLSLLGTL